MPETTVHVEGAQLVVRSEYAMRVALASIPGARWDRERKAWIYPASSTAAHSLAHALGATTFEDEASRALLAASVEAASIRTDYKAGADLPAFPFKTVTPPWRHQVAMVYFAEPLRAALWNVGLGVGKTRAALDLIVLRGHERTLVISPLSVVPAWAKQVGLHHPDIEVAPLVHGSSMRRAARATEAWEKATKKRPVVVVVNYECASSLPFLAAARAAGLDLLVFDEIQRLKAPGGVHSRALAKLALEVPYRLGLSGTPMPHSPMDAYGVFRALDPSVFGNSYVAFRSRYAQMGGFQGKVVVGFQNMDLFAKRIAPVTFEVGREVLDLPEVTHVERTFELDGEARHVYISLRNDLLAHLKQGSVTTTNALTRVLRLSQVASGHVGLDLTEADYDESGARPLREVKELHREKERLFDEVLEEIGSEPVVVFCRFRHDILQARRAAETLGKRVAELSGVKNELAAWQGGEAEVLVAQIQSGSEGIDLTRARYCVFWSLDYSLGRYEQALARVHRPGQDRPVTYVHLIAEKTTDRLIRKALLRRKDVLEDVLAMIRGSELE